MTRKLAPLVLVPAVHRATHRVGLALERDVAPDVSQAESHVLAHLAAAGPATVSALHAGLAHRRSTLTHVLDRLEERGWARRTVTMGDRRSFTVTLTAAGMRAARRAHGALARIERAALAGATPAQVAAIVALLDRLATDDG